MEAVIPNSLIKLRNHDESGALDVIRIPVSWDEYLELAEQVPYNIEYFEGEIIWTGWETDIHEQLVTQIAALLDGDPHYRVLGSNVKICVTPGGAEFNADVSVVNGPSEYVTLPSGRASTARIRNPEIIVEVLSKSTRAYDQSDKLDQYRLIPSLRHILFISQDDVFARSYSRTDQPNAWHDADYRSIDDIVRLGDLELPLRKIYRKTPLAD